MTNEISILKIWHVLATFHQVYLTNSKKERRIMVFNATFNYSVAVQVIEEISWIVG